VLLLLLLLMRLSKKTLVGVVKLKNQSKAGCFNYLSLGYSTRLLKASLHIRQKRPILHYEAIPNLNSGLKQL
jgi:hypothetical protein